jgi:hypothetical protein
MVLQSGAFSLWQQRSLARNDDACCGRHDEVG